MMRRICGAARNTVATRAFSATLSHQRQQQPDTFLDDITGGVDRKDKAKGGKQSLVVSGANQKTKKKTGIWWFLVWL